MKNPEIAEARCREALDQWNLEVCIYMRDLLAVLLEGKSEEENEEAGFLAIGHGLVAAGLYAEYLTESVVPGRPQANRTIELAKRVRQAVGALHGRLMRDWWDENGSFPEMPALRAHLHEEEGEE